jgi:hypothetical protein
VLLAAWLLGALLLAAIFGVYGGMQIHLPAGVGQDGELLVWIRGVGLLGVLAVPVVLWKLGGRDPMGLIVAGVVVCVLGLLAQTLTQGTVALGVGSVAVAGGGTLATLLTVLIGQFAPAARATALAIQAFTFELGVSGGSWLSVRLSWPELCSLIAVAVAAGAFLVAVAVRTSGSPAGCRRASSDDQRGAAAHGGALVPGPTVGSPMTVSDQRDRADMAAGLTRPRLPQFTHRVLLVSGAPASRPTQPPWLSRPRLRQPRAAQGHGWCRPDCGETIVSPSRYSRIPVASTGHTGGPSLGFGVAEGLSAHRRCHTSHSTVAVAATPAAHTTLQSRIVPAAFRPLGQHRQGCCGAAREPCPPRGSATAGSVGRA